MKNENLIAKSNTTEDGLTRHVRLTVSKKDLNNYSKFKDVVKGEPLYASTCGLSKSQMVLIAKMLRLNLDNTTQVKAEIRF